MCVCALVRYLVGYDRGLEVRAGYIPRQLFRRWGCRQGLRDVRALRLDLDPITRDRHEIKGADTAIEAGRP